MEGLIQDIRYAARKLSRQPGFTLVALLTLTLGIGANAVLFTLINAVLLRPPAGANAPDRLVSVYTADFSSGNFGTSSYADYEDFATVTDVFAGAAAYQPQVITSGTPEQPVRVGVELVSASYFSVLGVPLRGRTFSAREWSTGDAVAVVSHAYWQIQMGAAVDAIGRTVKLNGRPVTVIGIATEGFRGVRRGFGADVWLPMRTGAMLGAGNIDMLSRGDRGVDVIARLQPGVTLTAAQQRMNRLAAQMFKAFPENWKRLDGSGRPVTVTSERASRVPVQVRTQAYAFTALLSIIVALVLLICCANVAGLMLARARGLRREMGIRLAIGASRARLARLLLIESAILAVAAALIGLFATMWLEDILQRLLRSLPLPIALDFSVDHRVVLFTSFVALFAAVLFGAAPALRASRADPHMVIKEGKADTATGRGRFSFRSMLVAGQVAASVVLLVTALLFVRSMRSALTSELGFRTDNMALLTVEPEPGYEPDETESLRVAVTAIELLNATPGMSGATWANDPPLSLDASRRGIQVEGHQRAPGEDMEYHFTVVGPSYLTTMGMPLVRGRDLTLQDRAGSPRVLLVNETFARRFWPGQDPIGRRVMYDGENYATVIGVARDARLHNVGTGEIKGHMFLPALQFGWWGATLHVRTDQLTPARLTALTDVVKSSSPRWQVRGARTMAKQVAGSILPQRMASLVLAFFGTLALFLSAIGLYGVIAYAVAQRTHEFGIRFALGASTRDVLQLMVNQGLRVIVAGALLGIVITAVCARLLETLLLGLNPMDPVSFIAAPVILVSVGVAAILLPAGRAARIDPLTALRTE
jgi:predicted permease